MSRLDENHSSEDVNKEDECVPSSSEDSQDGVSSPMDNDDEPEFSQKNYDIEPCYYSMTGKSDRNCRGKVYRFREDGDLKGFQSHDGTMYRLRDSVFVEISQNEPYVIAAICGFKYTKREHVVVKLTRYFRADDIPDISLNLMKQERAELEINPQLCQHSLNRELFNSEIQITQPVSCLRGKCIVEYVKEVRQARTVADFSLDNDTFFFCLHYNQDSTKLAATHFAIRVGSSFQAKLPPMAKCSVSDEKDRDELLYRPNSIDEDIEKDYIKLARCFRTYTLSGNHMLDSQKNSRSQVSDLLMDEAIIQLHRSGYKVDDALSELNANDIILTTDVDNMTQDDAKKFAKGIKQLGKNFSRIHRELLPHHSREQLVSYYYLWKKTPEATKPKQAARRINPTSIKRPTKEKVKVSRPTSTEYLDFDSASESDVENNGPSGRACHHCYGAESKDWHHAGGLLLCTDCRLHYKKYGYPRKVENKPAQVPACLFKRSNSDEEESGVRTRAGKKEQRRRTPSSMSETPDRRSPSGASNGAPHLTAEDTPTKRLNGAAKRTAKRPLHNGASNNVEKANSVEPASPDSPPPKLTNGLTNGHAPGTSTPNGETVSKKMKIEQPDSDDEEVGKMTIGEGDDEPMPVLPLNGFKKEEQVEEMELNGVIKEEIVPENGLVASCSADAELDASAGLDAGGQNGCEVNSGSESNGEAEDDEEVEPDSEGDKYTIGEEIDFSTPSADFVRAFVRTCGPRCARTDLTYKFKAGSAWDKAIKEKAEKKKAASQQAQQKNHDSDTAVKLLSQAAQIKKEQQQQQAQQQHHQAQMQQQLQMQAAALMGQIPPEALRQIMPHQFGLDPAAAMIMQQLMHQPQMQNIHQQLAMQQHMAQQEAAHQQMMRMQEIAQQQQRTLREREQRERERAAAAALQQQQQQHAANAANQMHPNQIMAQIMAIAQQPGAGGMSQVDFARFMEIQVQAAQQQAVQAQQQAAQQQAQQREMERREREQREREQREREQREREAREREQREREQREQQAAREAAAQAAAAAQQQQAAAIAAAQNMGLDQQQLQQILMQQMLMNPGMIAHLQAQAQAQAQQQQQAPAGANPLHLLQQSLLGGQPMPAEMMRRLHAESAMRPQHP